MMDKMLTVAEVAEMIRVPEGTLRYWRHLGRGPRSFKMGPRRVVYASRTCWSGSTRSMPSEGQPVTG